MKKLTILLSIVFLISATPVYAAVDNEDYIESSSRELVHVEKIKLIPGGHTLGVKLRTEGILIINVSKVDTAAGQTSPAQDAGLLAGDLILQVKGLPIQSTKELAEALSGNEEKVQVQFKRGDKTLTTNISPAVSAADGKRKIGVTVRDRMAGIGTLSYYNPETGIYGALGHGINDVDTGMLLPVAHGSIVSSEVSDILRGKVGEPGELKGIFSSEEDGGTLLANTEHGIFGKLIDKSILGTATNTPMSVAAGKDVKEGAAYILSNVQGNLVERFDIEIVKVYGNNKSCRNFMIRVTDPKLLELTGGIVQGMSGSPIIQNGKLIGAVTHVLVNDPKKGFAIFMETMLSYEKQSATPTFMTEIAA